MPFNYEQSIWGRGEATLKPTDPTAIRLRWSLEALRNLTPDSRVLEVGCGAGQFIRAVKTNRPELQCWGTDISRVALAEAEKTGSEVSFLIQEDNKLPFVNSFVNAVLVYDVLEHVSDPKKFLEEIYRVLEPGGVFYAFVPCEGDILSLWNLLRRKKGIPLTEKYAGHIQHFSRKDLKKLFLETGFEIQELTYSEHFLGQLAGVLAFVLLDRAAKKTGGGQINNEEYFQVGKKNRLKSFANRVLYYESVILKNIPSPNIHLVVKKRA